MQAGTRRPAREDMRPCALLLWHCCFLRAKGLGWGRSGQNRNLEMANREIFSLVFDFSDFFWLAPNGNRWRGAGKQQFSMSALAC